MDIVINACYGGFSLSDKAEDLYAEKSGFDLFRYTQTKYKHEHGVAEYTKMPKGKDCGMFAHTYTSDQGDSFAEYPDEGSYWSSREIDRTDKILIEVVRELGSEVASGSCAKLEIIEIPDGVDYEISEYDGIEHIAESHRTWS